MLPNLFAKIFVVAVVVCLGLWILYILGSIAAGNTLYYLVFDREPVEVRMAAKLRLLLSISGVDSERLAARGVVFKVESGYQGLSGKGTHEWRSEARQIQRPPGPS